MELSKHDKKMARTIIEKGLQQEFANGLNQFDAILKAWKANPVNNHDTYLSLYKHIIDFDKRIGTRYDRMSGSDYLFIIVAQLRDGLIDDDDLENLSEIAIQAINTILNI